jgi:chemotaxis protein MotB
MRDRLFVTVTGFTCVVLFACATNKPPQDQSAALKTELRYSQFQLHEAEEKIKTLDAELIKSKEMGIICNEELTKLKTRHTYLKNINLQLSQNVEQMNRDLAKKKSVIQLQEKVIRLLDDTKKTIENSLKDEIAAQNIEIVEFEDKLKVVFVDKILFDSGSVEVNEKGKELLLVVAESIRDYKGQNVVVEGHTDNVALGPSLKKKFPSNWELSTARAAAVVRFLQKRGQLPPERLSARGYSYYRPVASNQTTEGRRQNRRIEIIFGPSM